MTENGPNHEQHPLGAGSHGLLDDVQDMPPCHPIKGTVTGDGSMRYHRPDSERYEATIPTVWFDSPSAAEEAGFELAPTHPAGSSGEGWEPGGSEHPCSTEEVEANRAAAVTAGAASSTEPAMIEAGAEAHDAELHPYGVGSHGLLANAKEMPACYPIKGNLRQDGSRRYHRPDSADYGETNAEVWFDSPSAAEAAGFTLSPSHPDGGSNADFEPGGAAHPCTFEQVRAARARARSGPQGATEPAAVAGADVETSDAAKVAAAGAAGAAVAGAAAVAGKADDAASDAAERAGAAAAQAQDTAEEGLSAAGRAKKAASRPGRVKKATIAAGGAAAVGAAGVAGEAAGAGAEAAKAGDAAAKTGEEAGSVRVTGEVDRAALAGRGVGDGDGNGIGRWLWYALAIVGLILLLALLASQCGDDDDDQAGTVGDADQEQEAEGEDVSAGAGDDTEATDATTTTGATTTTEATATTTEAPTDDLQAAALAALAEAGYDGVEVEVDGDAVRLVGTVGSEADVAAAEAAVAAVAGVESIDNELAVAAADDGDDEETPTAEPVDGEPDFTG